MAGINSSAVALEFLRDIKTFRETGCIASLIKMNENHASSSVPTMNENEKTETSDSDTLESLTAAGLKMLVEATKQSNNLPFGKNRQLYESYPSFHNVVKNQLEYVLTELSLMMSHTKCSGSLQRKDDEDKLEMIIDANDSLLENVGIALDELCGIHRKPDVKFLAKSTAFNGGSWNKSRNDKITSKAASQILNSILNQTKHIEKPQIKFKDKINNDSNTPFEPRIKEKPNMLKPLSCILQVTEDGIEYFTHPYEFELDKFTPPKEQMMHHPPILYKSLAETPLILVTTPEDVIRMVNDLEKYKEIAVDVEHHSYRSFQGFTCLLQISTRDADYVIDTLALRSELEVLNKVFTNPSIVKVFHGADLDILWLQRDLSVYVVNMFDTHQAAKLLCFPKLSLAYLLSHYCNVEAQKHFQLADWRIRPLPQELITYAREDTHYLLFIYDNLRNALIEKANSQKNLLESVISESTRICLKTYFKPRYESEGYMDIYRRSKKLFDNRQKFALQQLYQWRDSFARECDESYAYVLPDHMMLNISEILPREAQGILACCNPVPVPVRQNLMALHKIILKAREQSLIKPVLEEQKYYRYTASINSLDDPLRCPHDLNHEGEFRDDLPVLCNGNNDSNSGDDDVSCSKDCSTPVINIFENSRRSSDAVKLWSLSKSALRLTPYHLYKLSKKFSESVEFARLNESKKQTQENAKSSAEKEKQPNDQPNRDSSKKLDGAEICVKEESTCDKTDLNEKKVDSNKKKMSKAKKRKIEDGASEHAKKQKKTSTSANPSNNEEKTVIKSETEKKKKKSKVFQEKKKQFQPFDYNSVDFEKYKTAANTPTEKVGKIRKMKKKKGKKNFKIAV